MAYANILIGTLPNDGTGDPLRVAFGKINNNFSILETVIEPAGPIGAFQFKSNANINGEISNSYAGTGALTFDGSNVTLGTMLIPSTATIDIGSPANTIQNIYVGNSIKVGGVTLTGTTDTINYSATISAVNFKATSTLRIGTTVLVDSSAFQTITNNNNVDQTLYEIPMSQLRTARFEITSVESNTQNSQFAVIEATKQNNNSDVKYIVSGTIFVGTVLTHYSVTTAFGQLKFNVSPFLNSTITHSVVVKINT
jgi:hypothetical protein